MHLDLISPLPNIHSSRSNPRSSRIDSIFSLPSSFRLDKNSSLYIANCLRKQEPLSHSSRALIYSYVRTNLCLKIYIVSVEIQSGTIPCLHYGKFFAAILFTTPKLSVILILVAKNAHARR